MIIIKLPKTKIPSRWILTKSNGCHGHNLAKILLLPLLLHTLPNGAAQTGSTPPPPPPPPPVEIGFDFRLTLIIFLLLVIFFGVACFSVYVRERRERMRDDALPSRPEQRRARSKRGLGDEVIDSFPTFLYSTVKEHKIGKGTLECAVCLNEFEDDEMLRLIPHCSHVFHPHCIDEWLQNRSTCPVCRADLTPKPGEPVTYQIPEPIATNLETGGTDRRILDSPDAQLIDSMTWTNQNRPPRSRSTGLKTWRIIGILPRSISSGHTLARPVEDTERFTLRLPEEVRIRLVKSGLDRHAAALAQTRSPKSGYRSGSVGSAKSVYYCERFGREANNRAKQHRRSFSLNLPFGKNAGPTQSAGSGGSNPVSPGPPMRLFESAKIPLDQIFKGRDDSGERSSDRLRPCDQV